MVNIMLTYRCNRNCDYCFAKGQEKKFPEEMSMENFSKLLEWLKKINRGVLWVSLLGGEPTQHSRIKEILELLKEARNERIFTRLFTNGIFSHTLIKSLDETIVNYIVNYNPLDQYTPKEKKLLLQNLKILKRLNKKIALSYTINEKNLDYTFILKAAKAFNASIRFDFSHPSSDKSNIFFTIQKDKEIAPIVVKFIKEAVKQGIDLGMDCCVPLCIFKKEDLKFIRAHVKHMIGVCGPAMDINPDLSMYNCLAYNLKIKNVLEFSSLKEIEEYFLKRTRKLRWEVPTLPECRNCEYWLTKQCQGGCLGLKVMAQNGIKSFS